MTKISLKLLILTAASAGMLGSAAAERPVALVEDIHGKVPGIELMDYVTAGQVIKLGPKDSIVLGYMNSCWRETITGGVVTVGEEQSTISAGRIERSKVACDTGQMQRIARAPQSAGTTFRGAPETPRPQLTIYGLSPVVQVRDGGLLVIERLDKPGDRYEVRIGANAPVRGRIYDFAKSGKSLSADAIYVARLGAQEIVFKVDPLAKPGSTPIIGRLVSFQ
jgi:hypothetical protein